MTLLDLPDPTPPLLEPDEEPDYEPPTLRQPDEIAARAMPPYRDETLVAHNWTDIKGQMQVTLVPAWSLSSLPCFYRRNEETETDWQSAGPPDHEPDDQPTLEELLDRYKL